ncbi:MAG: Uma2 family endonuclease [Deltaproteobacteria bacterium]|nr:Uma2 family endonuclease [Deltaproteobacteria bacterium]
MMEPAPRLRLDYADYLRAERASEVKHEYLRGEIWAMAGGTPEHGRLAANVIGELRAALVHRPCAVFTSDVRVRVAETDRTTYPDVTVVCGERTTAPDDRDALTNPVVIVEVLSDSSEADDRGEKWAHYRRLASLRDYVIVSQRQRRLEIFHREEDDCWRFSEAGPGEQAALRSLGVTISVDAIYEDPAGTAAG